MKSTVLVTGSNGQLGKTFKELFNNDNEELDFIFTSRSQLDITNKTSVENFFKANHIDYCVNCAAYTNVDQAEIETEKAFKANAQAVKSLAEICKIHKTTLVHISTDYVFDGKQNVPYKENDVTNPINVYGESKLLGEKHIQDIIDNFYIIRASWLYSKYNSNFVKTIVSKLKESSNLNILTTQTGTPTSCIDLAHFIVFLINNDVDYGTYNFSALGQTNWFEFAKYIASSLNQKSSSEIYPTTNFVTKAERPIFSVLDTSKTQLIPYKLNHWKTSVETIIRQLENSK